MAGKIFRKGVIFSLLILFIFCFFSSAFANPLNVWHLRNQDSDLSSITYADSEFVAVGNSGTIITSPDGKTWTLQTSQVNTGPNALYGIIYADSEFFAVGQSGTILTSPDGKTWTTQTSPTNMSLQGITYGNNEFVTVGQDGTILTSSDGTTWDTQVSGTTNSLFGITYGNGKFVAVGDSGIILTSSDGKTWTSQIYGMYTIFSITYANNEFIAVGTNGAIITSPDGTTWTLQSSGTTNPLFGINYVNNTFIVVGGNYGRSEIILTSPDGIHWATQLYKTNFNMQLTGITYGNSTFIAVGEAGAILTSADSKTWTTQTLEVSDDITGITYGDNKFVAVGTFGTVFTSSDGTTWDTPISTSIGWNGVTYGNGKFVAVGYGKYIIMESSDGITWDTQITPTNNSLNGITYGNSEFVAVGPAGTILTSSDGTTWDTQVSPTTYELYGISYGDNEFVATGEGGMILTSSDGTTWDTQVSGTDIQLFGITYGNNEFVAVGTDGTIITSPDGKTWTLQNSGTETVYAFRGITYANGTFIVVGENQSGNSGGPSEIILASTDGKTWVTVQSSGAENNLWSVAFENNTFVAAGYNGTILQSDPLGTPATVSGTIDYTGADTGTIYIDLFTNASFSGGPAYDTQISSLGTYSISNIIPGTYYVAAYMSTNGSTHYDSTIDPAGQYANNPITLTSGQNATGINITLINPVGQVLSVSPSTGFSSSGNQGGPFSPSSTTYSVSNSGGGTLTWGVSADKNWVTVSPTSGTNSGTVTVSINSNANSLSTGSYTSTVTFTSNGGTITRQVSLTVNTPPVSTATVSGSISYSGSDTGNIYIGLFTNSNLSGNPAYSTEITTFPTTNTYSITGINPGTYYAGAFMSTNGSTSYDSTIDPAGKYASNPITLTSGQNVTGIDITLINPTKQVLSVSPTTGFSSIGLAGGPFSPSSTTYSVSNSGGGTLNWTVSADQTWVTVSPTSGTNLGTVTVSINSNANSLSTGSYTSTVTFTSNGGTITRNVRLTVSTPPVFNNIKIYDINGNQLTGNGDIPVDYLVQFSGIYTAGSDAANEETTIWTINDTTGIDTEIYKTNSETSSYIWIPRNLLFAGTTYSITAQVEDAMGLWSVPYSINFTTVSQSSIIDTTINPNTGAQVPSDQIPTDTNIKQYFADGILPDTSLMINFNGIPVLVETSSGTITYLGQITPSTSPPTGSAFDGAFTIKVNCKVGATITLTYVFPNNLPPNTKWYKYIETNPVGQQWVEYQNAVIVGNTVIVTLTDGGQGDQDGTVNGIILDPAGPVQQQPAPFSSGGGSGGVPVSPLVVILSAVLILLKTRKRKNNIIPLTNINKYTRISKMKFADLFIHSVKSKL